MEISMTGHYTADNLPSEAYTNMGDQRQSLKRTATALSIMFPAFLMNYKVSGDSFYTQDGKERAST